MPCKCFYFLISDIDECGLNIHDCQQICENTEDGYNCKCHQGFVLNDDRRSCTDGGYMQLSDRPGFILDVLNSVLLCKLF